MAAQHPAACRRPRRERYHVACRQPRRRGGALDVRVRAPVRLPGHGPALLRFRRRPVAWPLRFRVRDAHGFPLSRPRRFAGLLAGLVARERPDARPRGQYPAPGHYAALGPSAVEHAGHGASA